MYTLRYCTTLPCFAVTVVATSFAFATQSYSADGSNDLKGQNLSSNSYDVIRLKVS